MENQTTEQIIDQVVRRMNTFYLFWGTVYVTLGLLTVILPILITAKAFPTYADVLPPLTAIIAAAFAFLKPHEYATAFDAGKQEALKAQLAYSLGQLNDAEVSVALGRAVDVTTFKYGTKLSEVPHDTKDSA